jgi:hypothetical protein
MMLRLHEVDLRDGRRLLDVDRGGQEATQDLLVPGRAIILRNEHWIIVACKIPMVLLKNLRQQGRGGLDLCLPLFHEVILR